MAMASVGEGSWMGQARASGMSTPRPRRADSAIPSRKDVPHRLAWHAAPPTADAYVMITMGTAEYDKLVRELRKILEKKDGRLVVSALALSAGCSD